jgi:Phage integrase family.
MAHREWSDRGAVFRRLWTNRISDALSPVAVGAIVQRRAASADLKGRFGGHGLQSGFVTEASHQGMPLPAIMQMTEHRAVSSVMGYFQAGGAVDNPAVCLLDD